MQPTLRFFVQVVQDGCRPSHCAGCRGRGQHGVESPLAVLDNAPESSCKSGGGALISNSVVLDAAFLFSTHLFRQVVHAMDTRLSPSPAGSSSSLTAIDLAERLRRGGDVDVASCIAKASWAGSGCGCLGKEEMYAVGGPAG